MESKRPCSTPLTSMNNPLQDKGLFFYDRNSTRPDPRLRAFSRVEVSRPRSWVDELALSARTTVTAKLGNKFDFNRRTLELYRVLHTEGLRLDANQTPKELAQGLCDHLHSLGYHRPRVDCTDSEEVLSHER